MIAKDYNSRSAAYGWCLRTNENQGLHDGKQLFFRGHHRLLTVVILTISIKSAGSLTDGQSGLVGKLQNACEREGELSRVRKDYTLVSTAAFIGF